MTLPLGLVILKVDWPSHWIVTWACAWHRLTQATQARASKVSSREVRMGMSRTGLG